MRKLLALLLFAGMIAGFGSAARGALAHGGEGCPHHQAP